MTPAPDNAPAVSFPASWAGMEVTLSHDWLTGMRGGERVLEILCRGFPRAPILTLIHNRRAVSETINAHAVGTTPLQRLPGVFDLYRCLLPLFPAAVRSLPRPRGDMVISTSHCVAKAVPRPPGGRHLCYCFTPMRYAWTFFDEYFGRHPLKALPARPILWWLRAWDRRTAGRVDRFVAISQHVRDRIRRFYGREAEVVYPPVDTGFFTPSDARAGDFDLVVSALVPYKRIDLAVDACGRLGRRLKVVGVGGELERLQRRAGPTVEFLGRRPDAEIRDLYRRCRCLIFPGEEDFGIVPLEAQACGRPVVALARGGALETVTPGVGGVLFREQSVEALMQAVQSCDRTSWQADALRAQARRFAVQRFVDGLAAAVEACRNEKAAGES